MLIDTNVLVTVCPICMADIIFFKTFKTGGEIINFRGLRFFNAIRYALCGRSSIEKKHTIKTILPLKKRSVTNGSIWNMAHAQFVQCVQIPDYFRALFRGFVWIMNHLMFILCIGSCI